MRTTNFRYRKVCKENDQKHKNMPFDCWVKSGCLNIKELLHVRPEVERQQRWQLSRLYIRQRSFTDRFMPLSPSTGQWAESSGIRRVYDKRHFTFLDKSFAETFVSLSPKFGLRPKISQKVKSYFVWTQRFAERFAETKLRTERSLNPKLINSPVDFACTR